MSEVFHVAFTVEQAKALVEAASYGLYEWEEQLKTEGWEPIGDQDEYDLAILAYNKIAAEVGMRIDDH